MTKRKRKYDREWKARYRANNRELHRAWWRASSQRYRRSKGAKPFVGRCSHCYGVGHNCNACPERDGVRA
jgi:hypothetical protein